MQTAIFLMQHDLLYKLHVAKRAQFQALSFC